MPTLKQLGIVREFYGDEAGTLFCCSKMDHRFSLELQRLGHTVFYSKWVIQKDGFAGKGGSRMWVEIESTIPYAEVVAIFECSITP
jgi:hypothetical protein